MSARKLPVWVQFQNERLSRSERLAEQAQLAVRLEPAWGASVPAAFVDTALVLPCSGCTSPQTCRRTSRCASVKLDADFRKPRLTPKAWALKKVRHVAADWAKNDLFRRHVRHEGAELTWREGALIAARTTLQDLIRGRAANDHFPEARLLWTAYSSGILSTLEPAWLHLDQKFYARLTKDKPKLTWELRQPRLSHVLFPMAGIYSNGFLPPEFDGPLFRLHSLLLSFDANWAHCEWQKARFVEVLGRVRVA